MLPGTPLSWDSRSRGTSRPRPVGPGSEHQRHNQCLPDQTQPERERGRVVAAHWRSEPDAHQRRRHRWFRECVCNGPDRLAEFSLAQCRSVHAPRPANIAFLMKFDATGKLLFSTLLGGERNDEPNAIGLDSQGNIYIAGRTNSTTFPTKNALHGTAPGRWGRSRRSPSLLLTINSPTQPISAAPGGRDFLAGDRSG